jgi:ATP-dependent DNA helicase RecG
MPPLRPDSRIQFLKGIGERRAELFARLGVRTARDLLWHLPLRYIDASALTPVARVRVGDDVACMGEVVSKAVLPTRSGLRIFAAVIRDDSGLLECAWPGQAFLDRSIAVGQTLLVAGPIRFYHGRQMAPREHLVLADVGAAVAGFEQGKVLPVYPATEGLSHRVIRGLLERHLEALLPLATETLPPDLRAQLVLPDLPTAFRAVHRPASLAEAERGRRRLALDELLDLQVMLARARFLARRGRRGIRFEVRRELTTQLKESLPWTLTADQRRALREITGDMTSAERMHRLLMGDVGTGKTVVALFAMLLAIENGYQAALMAPTELLAEQHAASLGGLLAPLGIEPLLLLGRLTAAAKRAARARIASGEASLVVGTHALMQENTAFQRLGLVVVDEQHRFGVEQRAALIAKGEGPDVLLLSATPIPRSLALTRFGDLDLSVLRQRPPGRGSVRTGIRTPARHESVWRFVEEECRAGRQAYVVLPVIEESERTDLRAARVMADQLAARWPALRVGLVHGRLKAGERDEVMQDFREGRVQVLVATTVIEVGIDVPNATVMVIAHPERFGLAQLHQLRGRIGRGSGESTCVLLSDGPVPDRLRKFSATTDGFRIAELDLAERHHGDLLGERQSGGVALQVARFPEDSDLLEVARRMARELLAADPALEKPASRLLRQRAMERYPRAEVLFRIG